MKTQFFRAGARHPDSDRKKHDSDECAHRLKSMAPSHASCQKVEQEWRSDSTKSKPEVSVAHGLAAAFANAILRRLAKEIELRYTPQVRFVADDSYDEARRIDQLLASPRVRRDLADPKQKS